MLIARHAAVIGGGFSGSLLAINLLRSGMERVTLIERDLARLARGLAYGRVRADHILNVRAANMSAFPDEPRHFLDWLERRGAGSEGHFVKRQDYGTYLAQLLEQVRRDCGERLSIVAGEATAIDMTDDEARIRLSSGVTIVADIVSVASGNLPPPDLRIFSELGSAHYAGDPWAGDFTRGLSRSDSVLLIGSGLTAIDCALTLDASGFEGRTIALSRRGLAPHSHAPTLPGPALEERPAVTGAKLIRAVRGRARETGWRTAIDELRPFTQDLWRAADEPMRSRFLRHLRPFWDIHRHRLAPIVAARLDGMRARGRWAVLAGKMVAARHEDDGIRVSWRPRGADEVQHMLARRVINCTGPLGDLSRTRDALLIALRTSGLIRPDRLAIGIDVDRQGRAIATDGKPSDRLFIVGPMTRGAHWEIVAVPDIRKQVWDLARYLTNSQWVEAEGL